MYLAFLFIALFSGAEQFLLNKVDALLAQMYEKDSYRYVLEIRWMPTPLKSVSDNDITHVEYIGSGMPKGNSVFRARFADGKTQNFQVDVILRQKFPVLGQRKKSGESITRDELTYMWVDASRLHDEYITDINEIEEAVAVGFIKAGEPIRRNAIKSNPVLLVGQTVDMKIVQGGIQVVIPVEARQEAAKNETIRVYSSETRKFYIAKAISKNLVEWEQTL